MAIYRLPFENDGLWHNARNWDDPVKDKHGTFQAYAFDVAHPLGGVVRAARTGLVISAENVNGNTHVDPSVPLGGSLVRIRHLDKTVSLYAHFTFNSLLVTKDQYVLQGTKLGLSGNTGNSSGPHLHFDVRAFWNGSDNDMGPTIPVQFEDLNHSAWRPKSSEPYASNNTVWRQEGWKFCDKCHGLYFGDPITAGPVGGVCPKDGKSHHSNKSGNYILSAGAGANGQDNWCWCIKCQGLYFGGHPNSKCPAGGAHKEIGSSNYVIADAPNSPGQDNWRWCSKCQGLFFAGRPGSTCPADKGEHISAGSGNYTLVQMGPGEAEMNWRKCNKCQGLFLAEGITLGEKCPVGGSHDMANSFKYILLRDYNPATVPGQDNWRHCKKCDGLYFAGNAGSKCPKDRGAHLASDGNYTLQRNSLTPKAPGQAGWRWCKKCQGLFYAKQSGSKCPADNKEHSSIASGDYSLLCVECNDC